MKNNKLSILLPTFRFDATARNAIETVAAMASRDVSVHIGDNSCDPNKWAYLRGLADRSPFCYVHCHSSNIGPYGNWNFLWQQSESEFLCYVADDDIYTPDYFFAALEELRRNADCAAASGCFLALTWRAGTLHVEPSQSNLHATPVNRVAAYSRHTGINAMVSAVHRREAVAGYLAYMSERPFLPPYLDQFMTYASLAAGTCVVDARRQIFLYNNTNWVDAETITRSNERHWIECGFSTQFQQLHLLCWAVDVVHYFNSIYRPSTLDDIQSQGIIEILYSTIFHGWFLNHVAVNNDALIALFNPIPQALFALKTLIATPCEDYESIIALFVVILRSFDADIALRYEAFVARSLRPAAAKR
ncbi:glycosyltransferase family 2 protein [Lichenibacterium ramalinae]|uniref:Glycosyltransferase family 2 protein n=1 Tax=Lichenibacterium ramalinae TaxID=2316527 RepID=A0A4Q2RDQ6_9HYPH|nr:glycosyltransferase family A protein [Lichenibacterium ramalinae]RYB05953.1 glycosyltransferase family 2 protein [Lichenibacterium ramalinae]